MSCFTRLLLGLSLWMLDSDHHVSGKNLPKHEVLEESRADEINSMLNRDKPLAEDENQIIQKFLKSTANISENTLGSFESLLRTHPSLFIATVVLKRAFECSDALRKKQPEKWLHLLEKVTQLKANVCERNVKVVDTNPKASNLQPRIVIQLNHPCSNTTNPDLNNILKVVSMQLNDSKDPNSMKVSISLNDGRGGVVSVNVSHRPRDCGLATEGKPQHKTETSLRNFPKVESHEANTAETPKKNISDEISPLREISSLTTVPPSENQQSNIKTDLPEEPFEPQKEGEGEREPQKTAIIQPETEKSVSKGKLSGHSMMVPPPPQGFSDTNNVDTSNVVTVMPIPASESEETTQPFEPPNTFPQLTTTNRNRLLEFSIKSDSFTPYRKPTPPIADKNPTFPARRILDNTPPFETNTNSHLTIFTNKNSSPSKDEPYPNTLQTVPDRYQTRESESKDFQEPTVTLKASLVHDNPDLQSSNKQTLINSVSNLENTAETTLPGEEISEERISSITESLLFHPGNPENLLKTSENLLPYSSVGPTTKSPSALETTRKVYNLSPTGSLIERIPEYGTRSIKKDQLFRSNLPESTPGSFIDSEESEEIHSPPSTTNLKKTSPELGNQPLKWDELQNSSFHRPIDKQVLIPNDTENISDSHSPIFVRETTPAKTFFEGDASSEESLPWPTKDSNLTPEEINLSPFPKFVNDHKPTYVNSYPERESTNNLNKRGLKEHSDIRSEPVIGSDTTESDHKALLKKNFVGSGSQLVPCMPVTRSQPTKESTKTEPDDKPSGKVIGLSGLKDETLHENQETTTSSTEKSPEPTSSAKTPWSTTVYLASQAKITDFKSVSKASSATERPKQAVLIKSTNNLEQANSSVQTSKVLTKTSKVKLKKPIYRRPYRSTLQDFLQMLLDKKGESKIIVKNATLVALEHFIPKMTSKTLILTISTIKRILEENPTVLNIFLKDQIKIIAEAAMKSKNFPPEMNSMVNEVIEKLSQPLTPERNTVPKT